MSGQLKRRYRITVNGAAELTVQLDAPEPDVPEPEAPEPDGTANEPHATLSGPSAADVARGVRRFEVVADGWHFEVTLEPAVRAALRERATRAAAEQHAGIGLALRAQIPGRVVRLWVADGDEVEQGQRLLAVEAMKMENEIRAPHAGRVAGLRVELGQLVERGDELLAIS